VVDTKLRSPSINTTESIAGCLGLKYLTTRGACMLIKWNSPLLVSIPARPLPPQRSILSEN
jgi:hypothetical protein